MDQNNLARVFGPTIIGHGMFEPSPITIMRDTNTQPKVSVCVYMRAHVCVPEHVCYLLTFVPQVMLRLLSFSSDYWNNLLTAVRDQPRSHTHPERDQLISSVVQSNISNSASSKDRGKSHTFT